MKIRNIDDKPMVIHIKEEGKIVNHVFDIKPLYMSSHVIGCLSQGNPAKGWVCPIAKIHMTRRLMSRGEAN